MSQDAVYESETSMPCDDGVIGKVTKLIGPRGGPVNTSSRVATGGPSGKKCDHLCPNA